MHSLLIIAGYWLVFRLLDAAWAEVKNRMRMHKYRKWARSQDYLGPDCMGERTR
jgi:hypothetical protein